MRTIQKRRSSLITYGLWLAAFGLAGCADVGDKVMRLKGEVFYKESVSRTEAETLADWFVLMGYFDSTVSRSVQLDRSRDTLYIRFVVPRDYREELNVHRFAMVTAYTMSKRINENRPTVSEICNDRFQTITSIPVSIAEQVGGEIAYSNTVPAADAEQVGSFLRKTRFFNDSTSAVIFLDRQPDKYILMFVSEPGAGDNPVIRQLAAAHAVAISDSVLGGVPVDFYFVNSALAIQSPPVYFQPN